MLPGRAIRPRHRTRPDQCVADLIEDETGQVTVNLHTTGWGVHYLFGGFREPGSPVKEQGASGLRFYTASRPRQ